MARKAQTKNSPAPSTSCETPPRNARCGVSQLRISAPVDDVRRRGRAGRSQHAQGGAEERRQKLAGPRGVRIEPARDDRAWATCLLLCRLPTGISRPWGGTRDGRSALRRLDMVGSGRWSRLPARERRQGPGLAAHVRRALARPASGRRSKGLDGGVSASGRLVVRDGATGRRLRGRNERPEQRTEDRRVRPGWNRPLRRSSAPRNGWIPAGTVPRARACAHGGGSLQAFARAVGLRGPLNRTAGGARSRASSSAVQRRPYVARPSRRARAATAVGVRGVSSAAICSHVRPGRSRRARSRPPRRTSVVAALGDGVRAVWRAAARRLSCARGVAQAHRHRRRTPTRLAARRPPWMV